MTNVDWSRRKLGWEQRGDWVAWSRGKRWCQLVLLKGVWAGWLPVFWGACFLLVSFGASAEQSSAGWVDRVVVRFWAPELGGVDAPSYIFERELSFEARLEALSDRQFVPTEREPYTQAHVREALERHVAEAILESLRVTPAPTTNEIAERVRAAEASLSAELGGATVLGQVAQLEGLEQREIYRFLQRRARASLYIDRMVAPMLSPSEAELQALHGSGRTPFSRQSYAVAASALRRWYIARNLRHAVQTYYNGARARIALTVVGVGPTGLPGRAN